MSRATATRPAFVQQLHRAAAQRGRLDPVYQDLSDHRTAILQRLYPVWALIGPGLSDPGHIEIHSRTVYLDSETLLGPRAAIAAGGLERRAILRCFGVALHETMHAKHTKAARSNVYLQARTHYGILESGVLEPIRTVWERVLGENDVAALDQLYASVIWIPDGDLQRLDAAAERYREIVGEPCTCRSGSRRCRSSAIGSP